MRSQVRRFSVFPLTADGVAHGNRRMCLLVTALSLACAGERPADHRTLSVANVESWHLGEPMIGPIGVLDEPATHALFRPSRPLISPSGLITVANARSEIRVFTPKGRYVRTIGGRGVGPGEFEYLVWYDHLSDGRIIAQGRSSRLVLLDSLGTELGRSRLAVRTDVNIPRTLMGDEGLVGLEAVPPSVASDLTSSSPLPVRMRSRVLVFDHEGDVEHVVGHVQGVSWWVDPKTGGAKGLPLGARPALAARHDLIAVSDGVEYDVRFVRRDGSKVEHWVTPDRPPPATAEHLEGWVAERRESLQRVGAPANIRVLTPPFDEPELPDRLPAYLRFLFDARGCLWAERYAVPGATSGRWDVIDPVGSMIAHIDVPRDLRVYQVGDIVLGLEEDELGIWRIVGYRVVRPSSPRVCGSPFS